MDAIREFDSVWKKFMVMCRAKLMEKKQTMRIKRCCGGDVGSRCGLHVVRSIQRMRPVAETAGKGRTADG